MTSARGAAQTATLLAMAGLFGAAALGAWWWRSLVFQAQPAQLSGEAWEQIRQDYPLPEEPQAPASIAKERLEALIRANPFSPERLAAAPAAGPDQSAAGGPDTPGAPPRPVFAYKGRVDLGRRQRAILEDTAARKTYFLEVGQEVAGFKVLDIAENQVVLSDPQTHEDVIITLTSAALPAPRERSAPAVSP